MCIRDRAKQASKNSFAGLLKPSSWEMKTVSKKRYRLAPVSYTHLIQALTDAGLRDQVKVLIGGLCTSEYLMHHVGADGWAYDSNRTVRFCKEVVDGKEAAK